MDPGTRLTKDFYTRDVLLVARELIGKELIARLPDNSFQKFLITEVEAYRGEDDKACHASKGRTRRTEVMYHKGGKIYVYFVYGMYWMLNVVACEADNPQAVLIRGVEGCSGPGRVTRQLCIDKSYYGEDLTNSPRIWIEDKGINPIIETGKRIVIDFSGEPWKDKQWRFFTKKL
jgi:DNA-3-methyladenine glycosylase